MRAGVLMALTMKSILFWYVMSYILVEVCQRFRGRSSRAKSKLSKQTSKQANKLAWPISSTLNLETLCSSETSIKFYQDIWHEISEYSTLHATTISPFFQIHYLWSFYHFSTVNNLYSSYKHIQWSKLYKIQGRVKSNKWKV